MLEFEVLNQFRREDGYKKGEIKSRLEPVNTTETMKSWNLGPLLLLLALVVGCPQ